MRLLRRFTFKPSIYWNIVKVSASYGLSRAVRRPVVWGRPVSLMVEPINRCNLRCPLCPTGAKSLRRGAGVMALDDFRRILDNAGTQVRVLALWNQGEPTINDQLPQMIRIAHERGIYTMTSTNGNLMLRRNLVNRLIESGLDELIFSIDGLTQETYETYRVGGRLDLVINGMRQVRQRREELKKRTPRIVMQWLPMKHNEHEIPHLRAAVVHWGADKLEIKTTQIYTDEQASRFLPGLEALRRYERRGQRWETKRRYQSCRRLWFSTTVDWNGTVVACCFDKDESHPMGNALQQDFGAVWHAAPYNALRQEVLSRGRVKEMCRNCTEGLRDLYIPLTHLETTVGQAHRAIAAKELPADT